MKLSFLVVIVIALIALTSCQKGNDKIKGNLTDDTELIYAIQKASNKLNIDVTELPTESQFVLDQEYTESQINSALMAPKLGYEVNLSNNRASSGENQNQAYFNIKGRKLYSDKVDKENFDGDDKRKCFQFIYPITYVVPDGTEYIINTKDDKDGWLALKAWYESHPDADKKLQLQFPVDIKWKDGTLETINNQEEMKLAKRKCQGDKVRCFQLIYPVVFNMPDGTQITINSKEDRILIREWYAEHPDYTTKAEMEYPVEIKWKDGTLETINNQEEMKLAKRKCQGDKVRCFQLIYPVVFNMPDATQITINSKEDRILIREWHAEHPDFTAKPEIEYPVEIKYRDGSIVTINSKEEMHAAKEDCNGDND